jgi:hypothetical protein
MVDETNILEALDKAESLLDSAWAKVSGTVDVFFTNALAFVDAQRQNVPVGDEVDLDDVKAESDGSEKDIETLLHEVREGAAHFMGARTDWDKWEPVGEESVALLKRVHELGIVKGLWDKPLAEEEK